MIRHYVGDTRLSWVDCDDIAAVAGACLLNPQKHNGQTYRLGYEAKNYYDIAEIFTEIFGQPFSKDALTQQIPLGRIGQTDEIAKPALFLASEASS